MITDDLKTLIDTYWGDPSSVTQTCYVFIGNDPEKSEKPATTTTKVINIVLDGRGIPTRKGHGVDKWLFEGSLLTYSKTVANIKTAFTEFKRISRLSTTQGTLFFFEPNIEGEAREGNYVVNIFYKWIKSIAH